MLVDFVDLVIVVANGKRVIAGRVAKLFAGSTNRVVILVLVRRHANVIGAFGIERVIDRCSLGKDRVVRIGQFISAGVKQTKVGIECAGAGGFDIKSEFERARAFAFNFDFENVHIAFVRDAETVSRLPNQNWQRFADLVVVIAGNDRVGASRG